MPTRIVLRERAVPLRPPRDPEDRSHSTHLGIEVDAAGAVPASTGTELSPVSRIGSESVKAPRSSRKSFRSSILKELSVRPDAEDDDSSAGPMLNLSSNDIHASPRLLGYLFALIASAVMLASVVQFYRNFRLNVPPEFDVDSKYVATATGLVYGWKLWGAVAVASGGCLFNLLTIVAHFDSVLCPQFWMKFFRDGSLQERNLIIALVIFWSAGIEICTSSLSVGEQQANVYFTTWIAFGATVSNLSVWRESAGLPSLLDKISHNHRETTYNWCWTVVFSIIFAGAVTDTFINRETLPVRFQELSYQLNLSDWRIVLSIVWAEVGLCLLAITLNEYCYQSCRLPCACTRKGEKYRCLMGWRQMEGFVILIDLGGKFYVILVYTGVDGIVNGLSNAYFGVWGSFFCSVFCLGTWLRENKSLTYFVRDSDQDKDAEN